MPTLLLPMRYHKANLSRSQKMIDFTAAVDGSQDRVRCNDQVQLVSSSEDAVVAEDALSGHVEGVERIFSPPSKSNLVFSFPIVFFTIISMRKSNIFSLIIRIPSNKVPKTKCSQFFL